MRLRLRQDKVSMAASHVHHSCHLSALGWMVHPAKRKAWAKRLMMKSTAMSRYKHFLRFSY